MSQHERGTHVKGCGIMELNNVSAGTAIMVVLLGALQILINYALVSYVMNKQRAMLRKMILIQLDMHCETCPIKRAYKEKP